MVPITRLMFRALQSSLNSIPVKAVPLSVLMVCGRPFSVTYCSTNFFAVLLSVLQKCTPPAICCTGLLKVICKISGA